MELIFLCHAIKKPIGGIKVIYRHAELLNKLLQTSGHSASVMHPNVISFKINWFKSDVPIRHKFFKLRWSGKPSFSNIEGCFDPQKHIVVIPELWVRKYGDQLIRWNIPYAIYVQNGYYISKGNPEALSEAYCKAKCIMTISDDASRCVSMAFPAAKNNIIRMHCSIDKVLFNASPDKDNLITFMPRKLSDHSTKVLFFLREHLPKHWKIKAIDGLDEYGVAELLKKSKIFMSFSHFEGFGLPPLEAALCGNQVIGYTGQGGKEYWAPEIFEAVESGDVVGFSQAVINKINFLDGLPKFPINTVVINSLISAYSPEQEIDDMNSLILKLGLKKYVVNSG
jgi:glycosyltransferase involved in cell wall biosynthesis